ncbi:putative Conserved regulator of innate immunity protein 3 [Hypsibius exemplaris]|uniref:Conserved regulator of innate immunity protein 3 n=1 Tax=Hypsibius exemplaris TaxID=2072580 RepID=A0A1W0WQN9_HYPEX|nr:putative Conserved regulator of innate immunity protein 3 [Hypsibius exemplaris]
MKSVSRSAVAMQSSQQRIIGLGLTGQRNLSQVAASSPFNVSRSLTQKLLGSSTYLSQKRFVQTKTSTGDTEMSDFLRNEIQAEKESLKATGKAVQVKGWDVQTEDADITFRKKYGSEEIKVVVNVNHAVDAEHDEDATEQGGEESGLTKMVCKPNFHVEILKGGSTLWFNCAMSPTEDMDHDEAPEQGGETYEDKFNIEEFSIYKGKLEDKTYVMSGEIMDGGFYDNLMNMLDERGINSDFVSEVTDFATLYEQKLYVNLLENLQDIVKKN